MKAFLIFLGLAVACGAESKQDLKLKFGVPYLQDSFIPYPKTKEEAIAKGYELTPGPEIPLPVALGLYCLAEKDDKTICLYIDDETGHVAGMNVAIRKDEVSNAQLDWSVQGWTDWNVTTKDGNTVSHFSKQQFYVSQDFQKKSVQERIACRKDNELFPENAVWMSGFNNTLDRISTSEDDLKNSNYTKQNFFPLMGTHWYWKMEPTIECTDNTLHPWFYLTHKGKMIGAGLTIFAKFIKSCTADNFFENPGTIAVKAIVPRGPDCLYNLAKDGGIRTLHFYWIDNANTIVLP